MKTTTIAIALQKGGTGKTTTCATISHALALAGKRVLAVDLDPQGHLARAFGLDPAPGLYDLLIEGRPLAACIVAARAGVDLVPGDKRTAEAKIILAGELIGREQRLARALRPAEGVYDYCFFDCAPAVDLLGVSALVAADGVIVPVMVDYLATEGLAEHVKSLLQLRELGYRCELMMVLPTFYDKVTRESTEILTQLAKRFGRLVMPPIPRSVRLREAPAHGLTIWEYAPTSSGAVAYREICRRLLNGW